MRTLLSAVSLAAALVTTTSVTSAQDLLLDVNQSLASPVPNASPRELATIDGITYFSADSQFLGEGRELWRTDGTEAGTSLVADIATGSASSFPRDFIDLGDGTFLLAAQTQASGNELWRSNGTAAGTTMVKDIRAGLFSSSPRGFVNFQGKVYFFAKTFDIYELWSTDGTEAGTAKVPGFVPGNSNFLGRLQATPNQLFAYSQAADPTAFTIFASSDGTSANLIFEGPPGSASGIIDFVAFGDDRLFFESEGQPWISDGTVLGTEPICDCTAPEAATAAGASLFFAADRPAEGKELWVTDGTPLGTVLAHEFAPGPDSGIIPTGTPILKTGEGEVAVTASTAPGNTSVFIANATTNSLLFTAPSPRLLSTFNGGVLYTTTNGFGSTLWANDGTANNITMLTDYDFAVLSWADNGGTFFFAADIGPGDGEPLYKTDGTTAGTVEVADLVPNPTLDSRPSSVVQAGDLGFFFAETDALGRELYVTDGTSGGTQLVADLSPGSDSTARLETELIPLGNKVVFLANEPFIVTPYVSDGTAAGTFPLAAPSSVSGATDIAILNGEAYFFYGSPGIGRQIWKTDGTVAGTQLAIQLTNFGVSGGELTAVGDRIYFTMFTGALGSEPWVTDGTQAGTVLLDDIFDGNLSSSPSNFAAFGNQVVFTAETPGGLGRELWVTDGTPGGTSFALDVTVGVESSDPSDFTDIGTHLIFNATVDGGRAVFSVEPNFLEAKKRFSWGLTPVSALTEVNGQAVFFVDGGNKTGVWVTDGTGVGTVELDPNQEVWPTTYLGRVGSGELLAFAAYSTPFGPTFGPEQQLWVTDGTSAGTQRITLELRGPKQLGRVGNQITFADVSEFVGEELFTLPLSATGGYVAETFGAGCAGTTGVPSMTTSGAASAGELLTIGLEGALPNALTYLAVGTTSAAFGPDGCALIPDPPLLIPFATDASGAVSIPFVPDASFVDIRVIAQWATVDPAGAFVNKASLSEGLEIVFGP